MDSLPEEIISYILQYLSVSDRKEASLVCKLWYHASLDPMLLRDTVVTFHAPSSTPVNLDKLGYRKTPHLILDQIDGSFNSKNFLLEKCNHLTSNLESLSLKGSNITEGLFTELLTQCVNLKALDLSCCNSLFMSGLILSKSDDVEKLKRSLKNLTALNLSNIRYLSDTSFNRIITACLNIQKLQLAGAQIIFHSEKYFGKSNTSVLTFNNIITMLQSRATMIKSLDFSRTSINDEALGTLSSVKNLNLEELILVGCREVYSSGIANLARNSKGLKYVNLSQCVDMCNGALNAICEHLHGLKHLNISKCQQITDTSVKHLHMLDNLERLEMSSNCSVTSKVLSCLCRGKLQNLKHLNLNCCTLIKDSFVIQMSKTLNKITHLDMGSTGITDIGLQFICTYMTELRYLNLSWCRAISDNGLTGEVLKLEHNHCIDNTESGCRCNKKKIGENILNLPKIEDEKKKSTENALLIEPCSINNLQKLHSLHLTSCPKISDAFMTMLCLSELKYLEVGMNKNITDESLHMISVNMKHLEVLNINQCGSVTDDGIMAVLRSLRRLVGLHVSSNDKVTDRSIQAIQTYGYRLKELDVSMCGLISVKEMEKLEQNMRNLRVVQKRLIGGLVNG